MKRKVLALVLAAALCLALAAPALAADAAALSGVAYVGDVAACNMSPEMARAYADTIRATNKPVVRAALFDAGGGLPLLWVAYGDGIESQTGALDGKFGDCIYGYDGGVYECPWMTTLLRSGENGVIAQMSVSYFSDFAEDFELYRLSGGRIAETPFATGTYNILDGSTLNGVKVTEAFDEGSILTIYRMADPDVQYLLNAESGLADMLFLSGSWSDGSAMAAALEAYAAYAAPAAAVGVTVGGKPVPWTDAAPFIDENNRTMVPLRAVGDALGLTVGWDGAKREASFTDGTKTLYFPIDSSVARTGDGGTVRMDTAAVIVNDRTYAPVRYLAEFFGHTVDWDGATKTVIIK